MTFIHCADLHLDSPLSAHLPAAKARERRSEILSSFAELVEHADRNGVAAMLISGDLFDSSAVTRKTERYVLDLMASHPDLHFFYLAGNHDSGNRLSAGNDLPANLHTFRDEWTQYDFGDVFITGSEHPDPDSLSLPEDRLNIVMLHGQTRNAGTAERDAIPFPKYRNKHIDYLALGHLHTYQEAQLDGRGIACYSGCPEGRGFDECGPKGYILLETSNGNLSHRFVPFSRRQLHEKECDMTGCTTQREAETRLLACLEGIPAKDMVKAVLTGDRPAELLLDLPRLEQLLSERFYFAKLTDRTRLLLNPDDYAYDISLKGEFVRRVYASDLSEEEKKRVIECGFRALCGEELDI